MTLTQILESPAHFEKLFSNLATMPALVELYRTYNYLALAADSYYAAMEARFEQMRNESEGALQQQEFSDRLEAAREMIEKSINALIYEETLAVTELLA